MEFASWTDARWFQFLESMKEAYCVEIGTFDGLWQVDLSHYEDAEVRLSGKGETLRDALLELTTLFVEDYCVSD